MTSLFLSSWEWECCGERFAVGDTVTLTARPAGPIAPIIRTEDPLPGTARLEPIAALPARDDGSETTPRDEPAEGEIRSRLEGYLVELDV